MGNLLMVLIRTGLITLNQITVVRVKIILHFLQVVMDIMVDGMIMEMGHRTMLLQNHL